MPISTYRFGVCLRPLPSSPPTHPPTHLSSLHTTAPIPSSRFLPSPTILLLLTMALLLSPFSHLITRSSSHHCQKLFLRPPKNFQTPTASDFKQQHFLERPLRLIQSSFAPAGVRHASDPHRRLQKQAYRQPTFVLATSHYTAAALPGQSRVLRTCGHIRHRPASGFKNVRAITWFRYQLRAEFVTND